MIWEQVCSQVLALAAVSPLYIVKFWTLQVCWPTLDTWACPVSLYNIIQFWLENVTNVGYGITYVPEVTDPQIGQRYDWHDIGSLPAWMIGWVEDWRVAWLQELNRPRSWVCACVSVVCICGVPVVWGSVNCAVFGVSGLGLVCLLVVTVTESCAVHG